MVDEEKYIEVQVPVYGMEAVYKACYIFLDRVFIRLEGDPSEKVSVKIRNKTDQPAVDLEKIVGEFENELLHQALRVKVANANRKVRDYIVTKALSSAEGFSAACPPAQQPASSEPQSVLDEELEKEIEKLLSEVDQAGGSSEDPLKITIPWEEKHDPNIKQPADPVAIPSENKREDR